jgi:hypothetical protein
MASPSPQITRLQAKTTAIEVVLLALMREQRDNPIFWDRIEKVTAWLLADLPPEEALAADLVQDWLDSWRTAAGQDPSASGSVPYASGPG